MIVESHGQIWKNRDGQCTPKHERIFLVAELDLDLVISEPSGHLRICGLSRAKILFFPFVKIAKKGDESSIAVKRSEGSF